jgi:hypothetical protein
MNLSPVPFRLTIPSNPHRYWRLRSSSGVQAEDRSLKAFSLQHFYLNSYDRYS